LLAKDAAANYFKSIDLYRTRNVGLFCWLCRRANSRRQKLFGLRQRLWGRGFWEGRQISLQRVGNGKFLSVFSSVRQLIESFWGLSFSRSIELRDVVFWLFTVSI
jgi:hypothetical protein